MPDFVYALHDFFPENVDEISFKAGDRIEVIEKDDNFGDGWWQGKNLQGHIGLFPQSYTAPAPPVPAAASDDPLVQNGKSVLLPLDEESETDSAVNAPAHQQESTATIHAPIPKSPAILQQNEDSAPAFSSYSTTTMSTALQHRRIGSGSDGEVMKATLTDVQQAIEQLGRPDHEVAEESDRERSFSFASSRDGGETETDTDYENSDADGDIASSAGGESYHVGARRKLAETARRALEEADKLNAITNSMPSGRRMVAPPIDVEMSDESDDEGYTRHPESYKRTHPYIPEEDEDEVQETGAAHSPKPADNSQEMETDTMAVNDSAYTTAQSSNSQSLAPTITGTPANPFDPDTPTDTAVSSIRSEEADKKASSSIGASNSNTRSSPSDTRISEPKRTSSPRSNGYVIVSSLDGVVRAVSPQPQGQDVHLPSNPGVEQDKDKAGEEKKEKSPTEWTVDDVIDWLKSKGFDLDVQTKFIEQEITGDVLLELDANLLKSEIGIMAFGKRVRIANAIAELRSQHLGSGSPSSFHGHALGSQLFQQSSPEMSHQSFPTVSTTSYHHHHPASTPPHVIHGSVSYSPLGSHFLPGGGPGAGPGVGVGGGGGHQQAAPGHSRTYSASQHSQRSSLPGSTSVPPMYYSQSLPGVGMQQSTSMPSPVAATFAAAWGSVPGANPGSVNGQVAGMDSVSESVVSEDREKEQDKDKEKVGLGLVVQEEERTHRPSYLSLSPSDGTLSDQIHLLKEEEDSPGIEEEDRGHMSETDMSVKKKVRRRLWGLSHDSAGSRGGDSASRTSKEVSASAPSSGQVSPLVKSSMLDKDVKAVARPKKNSEAKTGTERLSIFGATFPGSLGKGRKPPPRYSVDDNAEKSSLFPLPRLSSSMGRKTSSQRPQTPDGSPKWMKELKEGEKDKEKEKEKAQREKEKAQKEKDQSNTLRKRTSAPPTSPKKGKDEAVVIASNGDVVPVKQGQSILEQIGEADHSGWMRKKGDRYNNWKIRYFVLTGTHLYCLRSNSKAETKIKGYINITGYKVTVDETVDPGKYGFRIEHDTDKTHYFSSDDKMVIRDWMKAIMKATIARDYSKAVMSSCNIPTIPLTVAQAMNPAPRPPSPSARAATQRAHRTKDLESLGVKDLTEVPNHATLVLMGLQPQRDSSEGYSITELGREDEELSTPKASKSFSAPPPPRPARESKRQSARGISGQLDTPIVEWANSHLPVQLRVTNPFVQTFSALALFRLAEAIKGHPASPPVPDSAFPSHPHDDKSIEGLFSLFDFLVNNEVKMGSVSINDVRLQRPDKVAQIVRALKSWEEKKRLLAHGNMPGSFFSVSLT